MKLDLPTVRALIGDDQSFSQRGLILELVERCEAAEAKLAARDPKPEVAGKLNGSALTFADFVSALEVLQSKRQRGGA